MVSSQRQGNYSKTTIYNPGLDLVVIDGFDRFSRPQRDLITRLSALKTRVLVTLTGEPDSDRLVYRRTHNTLRELRSDNPNLDVLTLAEQSFLPPALKGFESGFLNEGAGKTISGDDLTLLEVQSPAQEVREALRWIKEEISSAVVLDNGSALVVPNLDLYRPLIQAAANEFGMTVHFNQQELLHKHPGISAVLEMLTLKTEDYPRRVLIDVLRSPYFDLSAYDLAPHDASRMELVSRYGPVIGGIQHWREALARLATAKSPESEPDDEEEQSTIFQLPDGVTAARLLQALNSLSASLNFPDGGQSIEFWVQWLSELLEKWQWPQRCSAAGQAALVSSFGALLDGLRLTALELGDWTLNFTQFVQELSALLAIKEQPEMGVHSPADVEVLQMIEARTVRYDVVAVLGLAEGSYPQVEREDPFLTKRSALRLIWSSAWGRTRPGFSFRLAPVPTESCC